MKQFDKITINSRLEAKPVLLLIIWLFLIILPYFIFTESIDYILKESEGGLLSKSKIQLIDEVNSFRASLTSLHFLNSKLSVFPNKDLKNDYDALSLVESLERHTNSKVSALFYYNSLNNSFDAYIADDLKKELGLYSKYTMKNLLLIYASKIVNPIERNRAISYLQNFLSAAGGINFKQETPIPILSGKVNLGRMLGYFKTFGFGKSKDQMFLCLFREKDIPLKEIIKNAVSQKSAYYFKREILNYDTSLNAISGLNVIEGYKDKVFFKFQKNINEGLSVIAVPSDELLLRIGTFNTFYPLNIDKLLVKQPVIKVTLEKDQLEHPMRDSIKRLRFPTLLLIMLISFGLIKIGLFGYASDVRILGKVVLCVFGAVLLPFTSFVTVAYYNQFISEEYSENEVEHYTQIQTEIINKAVEAYIGDRELSITELREKLTGLSKEEFHKTLLEWIPQSGASVISYNYLDDKEIQIKSEEEEDSLSQFGKEAKDFFNISFSKAFLDRDLSNIVSKGDYERIFGKIKPNDISPVVTNIGKIYASINDEPNSLYSLFPIYHKEKVGNKESISVIGSVLIKFDTYKILLSVYNRYRNKLFHGVVRGKYIIRNSIIPINNDGTLPSEDRMFFADGFPINEITQKLNQILINKTKTLWTTKGSINTGTYLNIVNSLVVSRAEKIDNAEQSSGFLSKIDIKSIFIYILLIIIALSVMLGSIIVSPIRELQKASERVAQGDYSYKIEAKTGDEFESLSEAFNEMTEALMQKEKMTSYVSKDVIEEVSNNNEHQLQPSGERIPVSVLFCALSGDKELSMYSPEEVTKIISCLIDAVDEISSSFNGQVDKLIEDTVMVVFRETASSENIALNACRAALAINNRLKKELPDFKIKMGIASGDAVSGKIGSRNGKLDYTVIGNPVNLAARLKVQAGKAKNTGILICPNSIRLIQGAGRLKFIERMTIKGRTNRTFPLYELLGLREYY